MTTGITTSRVLESFQRHLRAENKSARTLRAYTYGVQSLFDFLEDRGMPGEVEHVKREHIEAFMEWGLERVKPTTVHQWYRSCQQFFKWLADEDWVTASPMANMRAPFLPEELPPVLKEEEIVRLLKTVGGKGFEDRRDNAVIRLMLDTGMRLAECAGIFMEHLDINQQVAVVTGKGRRERACPFGNKTAKAIDRYLIMRSRHRQADEQGLWLAPKGKLTADGMYQMIKRRGEEAGVVNLYPHRLRHSFANMWLAAGASEVHLMALAGWRSRSMVARYAASAASQRAADEHQRLGLMDRL